MTMHVYSISMNTQIFSILTELSNACSLSMRIILSSYVQRRALNEFVNNKMIKSNKRGRKRVIFLNILIFFCHLFNIISSILFIT